MNLPNPLFSKTKLLGTCFLKIKGPENTVLLRHCTSFGWYDLECVYVQTPREEFVVTVMSDLCNEGNF